MALAPERITVKRRRDEDPVEALYLQSSPSKRRPGIIDAIWTLESAPDKSIDLEAVTFQDRTVSLRRQATSVKQSKSTSCPISTSSDVPVLGSRANNSPIIQPDASQARSSLGNLVPNPFQHVSASSLPPQSKNASELGRANDPRVRRFHLSHASLRTPSRSISSVSGIHKSHRGSKKQLAVFEEVSKRLYNENTGSESWEHLRNASNKHNGQLELERTIAEPVDRKRPQATAEERAWRTRNWASPKNAEVAPKVDQREIIAVPPSTDGDDASLQLAQELQKFAMETSSAQTNMPQGGHLPTSTASVARPLKFKPKPPKIRHPGKDPVAETVMDVENAIGKSGLDETSYVVDTYIRADPQAVDLSRYWSAKDQSSDSKIGIIVIDEEAEAVWETFADDCASDPEADSEEEDENAEDYYGNDYPEDELSSDDERNQGAYNFRIRASDDEEYDDDEPLYSDTENQYAS